MKSFQQELPALGTYKASNIFKHLLHVELAHPCHYIIFIRNRVFFLLQLLLRILLRRDSAIVKISQKRTNCAIKLAARNNFMRAR